MTNDAKTAPEEQAQERKQNTWKDIGERFKTHEGVQNSGLTWSEMMIKKN